MRLLAARAPSCAPLRPAEKTQHACVMIDGRSTYRPGRRGPAVLLQQTPRRGMSLWLIADPEGEILSVSGALPGAVHDLTDGRTWESWVS